MAPVNTIALMTLSTIGQALMIALLPATRGYTSLWPTIACIVAANTTIWLFARILQSGVSLGLLIPFSSAAPPIVAIVAGIFLYGDAPSIAKLALLLGACAAIAAASLV